MIKKKKEHNGILRYKLFWIALLIILLVGGIFFAYRLKNKASSFPRRALPVVNLTTVKAAKAVKHLSAIGIIKAAKGIQLSAEIPGIITAITFHSGQSVQAGETLVVLRNSELKATVQADQAKYYLDQLNAKRSAQLVNKNYVSRQQADQDTANAKQSKAQLTHDQALLKNTIIKAPFSGQLGISQVDLGQYVNAGQVIVSLQDRSKMYVDFSISEKQSDLLQVGESVVICSHQGETHQWHGKIVALGVQMNSDTHMLPVRAEIMTPYLNLTPGMYVDVSVLLPNEKEKPAVLQQAIVYNPYGNFVYLYQKNHVVQRYITLGSTIGDRVFVEKGLRPGDQVVSEGQQKLFNGARVKVGGL